jgi:putative redox protein
MLDRIESELELLGPLAEGQRARLHEIADRCPVQRTLQSEVDIQSRLA